MDPAQSIGWSCQLQDLLLSLPFFCIVLIPTVCSLLPIFSFLETAAQRVNRAAIQLYEYIFCVSLILVSLEIPSIKVIPCLAPWRVGSTEDENLSIESWG